MTTGGGEGGGAVNKWEEEVDPSENYGTEQ